MVADISQKYTRSFAASPLAIELIECINRFAVP
jgi:hypothetical protein